MKEFMGTAINESLTALEDGSYGALAELILITSEPTYSVSAAGELIRQRTVEHLRLSFTARSMRGLIESLDRYATNLESLEGRAAEAGLRARSPNTSEGE